jgi:hypothetical protein
MLVNKNFVIITLLLFLGSAAVSPFFQQLVAEMATLYDMCCSLLSDAV